MSTPLMKHFKKILAEALGGEGCAVAAGSPAGDAPKQPKPLPCRLADLLQDWKKTSELMRKRGETEAADAIEICGQMLHEDVSAFFKEMKIFREHSAKQENIHGQPRTENNA